MGNEIYKNAIHCFVMDGEPVRVEPYGCGHINHTFLVTTDTGPISGSPVRHSSSP